MKKTFFLLLTIAFLSANAQRLNKITLTGGPPVFSYLVDDVITLNISPEGKILDWGLENTSGRGTIGRLDKYMGRVEYYDSNENVAVRGKVKYLGRTAFTYFTSTENDALKGKIKTMNNLPFDYYNT